MSLSLTAGPIPDLPVALHDMSTKFDVTPHLEDLWRCSRVLTRDDCDADEHRIRVDGFGSAGPTRERGKANGSGYV